MKKIFFPLLFLCLNVSAQQFDYFQCLKKYWNYRYHLVGDAVNRSQHMPYDIGETANTPDFLSPAGIGEPGMLIIGTGANKG